MSDLTSSQPGTAQAFRPPGCPVFDFDPLALDHVVDPWPRLAQARREQPVFYMPDVDMWAVTRFEDVQDMLRDTKTFSSAEAIHMVNPVPDEVTIPPGCPYPELENVAQFDPPAHTRLRKLMQPGFSPKRLAHRTDEVRAIADGLIDQFIDKGGVDLVAGYSDPIPIRVMAMILGFPPEAAAKFRYWTDSFFDLLGVPGLSNERVVELWEGLLDSDEYTRELIEERRRRPADDLISDLVTSVTDDGSPSLTDEEITANMHAFIVAGTDTTAILLSQMVYTLLEDRDRWDQVCADHELISNAVEETLRFRGPIRGLNRMTTRECELGGVTIPKGARLYWMVSSANLDEAHYDAPDRFDLNRPRIADHLAFGKWTHFCIGAPLARLEARIALEQLVTRVPGMRLAQEGIEWVPNLITPAPAEVIVEWDVQRVIKGYSLLAKRPDVSSEFFHEHWRTVHADHAQKLTTLRRYIQAHRIDAEVPGFAQSPYEGIAEVWWDDLAAADLVASDPDYLNGARLDEPTFIDMPRLANVLTQERPLEPGPDLAPDGPEVALLLMLKRRSDVSLEDFRSRWPAEAEVAITSSPHACRVVTALTIPETYADAAVEPVYDGVAELSWPDRATYEDDWGDRGSAVAGAVMAFCDPERTHGHLADENRVIWP